MPVFYVLGKTFHVFNLLNCNMKHETLLITKQTEESVWTVKLHSCFLNAVFHTNITQELYFI